MELSHYAAVAPTNPRLEWPEVKFYNKHLKRFLWDALPKMLSDTLKEKGYDITSPYPDMGRLHSALGRYSDFMNDEECHEFIQKYKRSRASGQGRAYKPKEVAKYSESEVYWLYSQLSDLLSFCDVCGRYPGSLVVLGTAPDMALLKVHMEDHFTKSNRRVRIMKTLLRVSSSRDMGLKEKQYEKATENTLRVPSYLKDKGTNFKEPCHTLERRSAPPIENIGARYQTIAGQAPDAGSAFAGYAPSDYPYTTGTHSGTLVPQAPYGRRHYDSHLSTMRDYPVEAREMTNPCSPRTEARASRTSEYLFERRDLGPIYDHIPQDRVESSRHSVTERYPAGQRWYRGTDGEFYRLRERRRAPDVG